MRTLFVVEGFKREITYGNNFYSIKLCVNINDIYLNLPKYSRFEANTMFNVIAAY